MDTSMPIYGVRVQHILSIQGFSRNRDSPGSGLCNDGRHSLDGMYGHDGRMLGAAG